MQITNLFVAALFAANSALAAPAPATGVSQMAAVPEWTIENTKRVCNSADSECTWTFGVNTGVAGSKSTACTLTVKGAKASQRNGGPANCGSYTVTSGWSGQFGPNNGFTTLSVVDNTKKLIVWPAYTDNEVKAGKVVSPNKKYAPAKLP
ncbi:hypothetical protein HJFPF1_10101 [Paramyrothecium foliicola]|nr:hypothetical protein HJFPF1_10101 [Paramyrothecium foliicola]